MAKTAGEILFSFATALGVPADDASLEAIKNSKELFSISLTPAFEQAYEKEFITVTAAKNNGEIKKHYNGLALGTIDNKNDELMAEWGLDDATKAEIKKQDSTYKRTETLLRKLKSLSEKAAAAPDGKEKDKMLVEIQSLNAKISDNEAKFKQDLEAQAHKWQEDFSAMVMESKLSERPLIDSFNGKDPIPRELVLNTAKQYIDRDAVKKGVKIVYNHAKKDFDLVQASNPELPYMEDHKPVSFNEFRDKVLANEKLIKVTTTGTAPKFTQTTTTAAPVQESQRTVYIQEKVDSALNDLRNAPAPVR